MPTLVDGRFKVVVTGATGGVTAGVQAALADAQGAAVSAQSTAATIQALGNYRPTIAAALALTTEEGEAFTSDEGGTLLAYRRTGNSPFYERAPELDPVTKAQVTTLDTRVDALEAGDGVFQIASYNPPLNGVSDDSAAFLAALADASSTPNAGGIIRLGSRKGRLERSIPVKRSTTLDLGRTTILADTDAATFAASNVVFDFGWGVSGTVNQIGDAGIKNLRLELYGDGAKGIGVQNAGGLVFDDIGINLRGANQVGFHAKANLVPNAPYYTSVSNLAIRGEGLPSQIGILIEGLPETGSITVNRWVIDNIRDLAALGVGLDCRGTDGLVLNNVNFESNVIAGPRFGVGCRTYNGTVTAVLASSGGLKDAGLATMGLDQSLNLVVLTGPNAGFSTKVRFYDAGTQTLYLPFNAPYAFTVGDTYVLTEAKSRNAAITNATFEMGAPTEAAVYFAAGAASCDVVPRMFTQEGGVFMRRDVETISNTFGKRRQTFSVPFTWSLGTDGASGSKVISPGFDADYSRAGFNFLPGGFIDAVYITSNKGDNYGGEISATVKVGGTALAESMRPKITRAAPTFGQRIRKSLTAADLFDGFTPLHVEITATGMETGCSGTVSFECVEL